jgi:hypothetical protein
MPWPNHVAHFLLPKPCQKVARIVIISIAHFEKRLTSLPRRSAPTKLWSRGWESNPRPANYETAPWLSKQTT